MPSKNVLVPFDQTTISEAQITPRLDGKGYPLLDRPVAPYLLRDTMDIL